MNRHLCVHAARSFPLLLLSLIAVLAASAAAATVEEVRARGKLVMLCVPHQESHFVRTNTEAGPMRRAGGVEHFRGVDVDLMAAFAARLGVELEVRPAIGEAGLPSYTALIPALLEGEGDLIASSFSITAERGKRVSYSKPYYSIRPQVIARKGSGIATVADLAGKRASAIPGSSQEEHLQEIGVLPEDIQPVEFMLENYMAVDDGAVSFTLVDSGSAERVLPGFGDLEVAFGLEAGDDYGVAVAPGSDLLEELNRFFEEIRDSGELKRILTRHGA